MDISADAKERLEKYHALLHKWQPKINLISNNTLDDSWGRHFEDSLQLINHIDLNDKVVFDIGTGAGFPGLVLAIANSSCDVHLIESDQKKCSFLKTVSRETKTDAQVINERIEQATIEKTPDIITARALASLVDLFDYCEKWIEQNANLQLVFMKGERAAEELALLAENWTYDCCTFPSITNRDAKILVFTNICRK